MLELFKKIQKAVLHYFMRIELQRCERKKMVMGLDEAKTIGVIFDASTAAEYRLVLNYVKQLQDLGKKVRCLGFVQMKNRPGYLLDHPSWAYCQEKDFRWNLKLKTKEVIDFVHDKPDILIDLSPPGIFYTKYLSGLSCASYKVGTYNPEQVALFDLLMQVPEETKIQELMDHINHYLKIIKKPIPDAETI